MTKLISCEFNIDTASVQLKLTEGSMVSTYCTAVEDQVAENRMQRSELDWLIYNEPLTYAQLVMSDELLNYLNGISLHSLED